MAVVKKLAKEKKKVVVNPKRKTSIGLDLSLPTEKSIPSTNLEDYTNLIYGKKKIGKTTLTSWFENTFHLMFEAGSKALSIYARPVPSWEHFLGYIQLLESGKHEFKNIVIDTGAVAYDRDMEYICKREGINHPSDRNDYGATWSMVRTGFEKAHARIMGLGLGLLIIAHEKVETIESRSGVKYDRIVPALSGQADEYYAGMIDNIFYYHYIGSERFLTIRGDEFVVAGTRCEKNFLTPDGEQIYRIPMDNNSKESYGNLVKAFNNEQTRTYKPSSRKEEKKVAVVKKTKTKTKVKVG